MSLSAISPVATEPAPVALPKTTTFVSTPVAQSAIPSDKVTISPVAQKLSTASDGDSDGH